MEPKVREFEQLIRAARLPGVVAEVTLGMDDEPSVYDEAVVFASKEAYRAVAESPEQGARCDRTVDPGRHPLEQVAPALGEPVVVARADGREDRQLLEQPRSGTTARRDR